MSIVALGLNSSLQFVNSKIPQFLVVPVLLVVDFDGSVSAFFTASRPHGLQSQEAPASSGSASNRYGSGKPKGLDEKHLLHSYFVAG
jgi:hypothetical protein